MTIAVSPSNKAGKSPAKAKTKSSKLSIEDDAKGKKDDDDDDDFGGSER
jgi:hypothetical protein